MQIEAYRWAGRSTVVMVALAALLAANSADAKTYLINGIASAVPFIGFGMNNLGKKVSGDKRVYSFMTPVEGVAVIRPSIIKEIEQRYRRDPTEPINLIGISYGADMITTIARSLSSKGIPVHYLGVIDGTRLAPIEPNVFRVDNFTCTFIDCTRAKIRLAPGNQISVVNEFSIKSAHIPLSDNKFLHKRVLQQLRVR